MRFMKRRFDVGLDIFAVGRVVPDHVSSSVSLLSARRCIVLSMTVLAFGI